jgi:hypothetical protein
LAGADVDIVVMHAALSSGDASSHETLVAAMRLFRRALLFDHGWPEQVRRCAEQVRQWSVLSDQALRSLHPESVRRRTAELKRFIAAYAEHFELTLPPLPATEI